MANWSDLAKQTQDVIDKAVAAVTTTKVTQSKLEQQLDYTDRKVDEIHNLDAEAHPDIREQLSKFFDPPTISGPSAVEYGEENTWEFDAVTRLPLVKLEKFYVDFMDGTPREVVPANPDGSTIWKHTFYGERNSTIWFTVTAYGNSFVSEKTRQELFLTHHLPPDMSNMVCTLPTIVNRGQTYTFQYYGVTDEDGDLVKVNLNASSTKLTFSATDSLEPNQEYTLSVAGDANDPEDVSVTFTAIDARGLTTTKTYIVHINGIPNISNLAHTLPNRLTANTSVMARFSGITDADGESTDITIDLASSIPEITFGKTTGIKLNEDVSIITSSSATPGTAYTLTLTIHDGDGAVVTTTLSSMINILPDISGLVTNQREYMFPSESREYTYSGAVDADDQEVIYGFETDYPGIIEFSKTNGVQANEPVLVTLGAAAVRGQAYTYRVTATDKSGAVSKTTRTIKVNQKISESDISYTPTGYSTATEPSTQYTLDFTPTTNPDGRDLIYSIVADDIEDLTFESTGAHSFVFTSPGETTVARGSSYTATVTADDGVEKTIRKITINQNQVPDVTNFSLVTVKYLTAGITNKGTVVGVTNEDGTPVTFTATSSITSITIPGTNEIDKAFDINVSSDALPGQEFTITFTFTDGNGGTSTAQYTGQINAAPDITGMTLEGLPSHLVPGSSYTLKLTGASDPNAEGITYTIQNPGAGLTFSKYTDIAEGEAFTMVVSSDVVRGSNISFVVAAVDPSAALTGRTYTAAVNRILTADECLTWLPAFRHPDTTTYATNAVLVDADGHSLSYTLSSSDANVQFVTQQDTTPVATLTNFTPTANNKFGLRILPGATRDTEVTITAAITDGFETWNGTKTFRIKAFPTEVTVAGDGLANFRGGNEFKISVAFSWVDPDSSRGYDSSLTTWTGYTSNGYYVGSTGVQYTSAASVTLRAPKVAKVTNTTIAITLNVSDGISSVANTYNVPITVNPIIVTAKPTITSPKNNEEVAYEGFTISITSAVTAVDMDENNVYPSAG